MKGAIFTFILLIGFLFVSVAESKIDVHPTESTELSISTYDSDLLVELQSIELQYKSSMQETKKQVLIVAETNRKKSKIPKIVKLRRLSNPGKLGNNTIFNYTKETTKIIKYKTAYGLRNRQNTLLIV